MCCRCKKEDLLEEVTAKKNAARGVAIAELALEREKYWKNEKIKAELTSNIVKH